MASALGEESLRLAVTLRCSLSECLLKQQHSDPTLNFVNWQQSKRFITHTVVLFDVSKYVDYQ